MKFNEKVKDALETKFFSDDLDETLTVKEYFKRLLLTLWDEKEGFSGKRPFGNSGWEYELYKALIQGGFVKGSLDSYGDVKDVNEEEAEKLVAAMIREIFK